MITNKSVKIKYDGFNEYERVEDGDGDGERDGERERKKERKRNRV
jgi:hypothetical protein